jgi:enoyl-CoA hydratase/carnithine racemase
MNRPEVKNAMDHDLVRGLADSVQDCFDESIRAVVLTGSGNSFCQGGDIAFANQYGNGDPQAFFRDMPVIAARLIADMRQLPKPIIASINGVCAGVGISFAAACDIRICHTKTIFKQAYTGVGINPDVGFTQMVPIIIGLGRASEMIFLDEVITAQKALEWGLVNKVVEPEQLAEETAKLAAKLASGATKAFAVSKALLNKSMLPYIEVQMEAERLGVMQSSLTEDYKEGVAFFTGEKKKPEFKGK